MLQWIELLTKQFNNSQAACEVKQALHSASLQTFTLCFLLPINTESSFVMSLHVSVCDVCSGFWIRWQMTTGGPCRFSSSAPIRSCGRWVSPIRTWSPNLDLVLHVHDESRFPLWCFRCSRGCVSMWSRDWGQSTLTCTCSRAWRTGVWCTLAIYTFLIIIIS